MLYVQDRRNGSSPGPIPRECGQFFFFFHTLVLLSCHPPETRYWSFYWHKVPSTPGGLSSRSDPESARGWAWYLRHLIEVFWGCSLHSDLSSGSEKGHLAPQTPPVAQLWFQGSGCAPRGRGKGALMVKHNAWAAPQPQAQCPTPSHLPPLLSSLQSAGCRMEKGEAWVAALYWPPRHLRLVTPMPQLGHRTLPDLEPRGHPEVLTSMAWLTGTLVP